ncbi:MAG: hypothetical protein LCH26_02615 [Proteobacteria bacterium]|nr:hypothetical protein [Pseudomonadota bacterium]
MTRIFIILLASVAAPAFSSGLPPHQAVQLSEENKAWIEKELSHAGAIVRGVQEHMANPNSTQQVPGVSSSDLAWAKKSAAEAAVVRRYVHQQMSNPGAKPEPAFHALPEHLKAGAQQAIAYMRSQGYQGPKGH